MEHQLLLTRLVATTLAKWGKVVVQNYDIYQNQQTQKGFRQGINITQISLISPRKSVLIHELITS